jgi:hypothetical protein
MGRDFGLNGPHGWGFKGLVLTAALFVVLGWGVLNALYAQGASGDGGAVVAAPSDAPGAGGSVVSKPAQPVLRFAYKAAVSGNYAVVGAEWHDGFKGMAYLYRRDGDTWVEPQKLAPSDLGRYDHFGSSVAMSGDVAVVGAPWQDLFRGAVYVFVREGDRWVERQKLTARDGSVEGYFGRSVFVDGESLLVMGAGREAYRFERTGGEWVEKGKVPATALEAVDAAAQTELAEGIVYGSGRDPAAFFGKENVTPPSPAPMAPVAPDWVKATGGSLNPREIEVEVTWSVSVPQDAIVYKVYRDNVLISYVSSDERKFSDTTAEIGETYSYCVSAEDMFAQESARVCDPVEGGRIIFAPTGVSATDGTYVDKVRIEWVDMSTINTGYSIRRETEEIGTVGPNVKLFDDRTADPEVVYSYDLVATVTGGYESAAATDTSGWRGVILPPKNVSASDGQYLDRVRITWENQAPDTLVYAVYRDGSPLGETAANATSYIDSTVVFGVTYNYCVATKEPETLTGIPAAGVGSNALSTTESVQVCDQGGTGLAAPSAVSASDATYDDRIRITWKDNSDFEDGYEISREVAGNTTVVDTTRANIKLYDDFTADPDVTYMYHVRAVSNLGGVSADSSDAGYRSKVLAPYDVVATDGTYEDYVNITWKSTSTTAVLFKIYRDGELIKSVSKGDRSYQDYGGTAGVPYRYEVAAFTALGVESERRANWGSRELRAPSQMTASDEEYEDKIVISWQDNSEKRQGYVLSRLDTLRVDSVGVYDTYGPARGVAVANNYAYVTDQNFGLHVIDISDPSHPDSVGSLEIYGGVEGVAVSGNYAYVCNPASGLRVIDVSDKAHPSLAATYDAAIGALEVVVVGPYAYVLWSWGLAVIDISDPLNPEGVGSYVNSGENRGVAVSGGYAYIADGNRGLQVIDISDPTAPDSVGSYDTPDYAEGVAVVGRYAFVADWESGLQVIDVRDPAKPVLAGRCDTPGQAGAVAVAGHFAYVASFYSSGVQAIDIADPTKPVLAWDYGIPGAAWSVAIAGDYAYVGVQVDLQVLHIDDGEVIYRGANSMWMDYTAIPGVPYTYYVSALDSLSGTVGYSTPARDVGRRVLLAPTNVRADKGISETEIEITWTDNSNAEDGYVIYRNSTPIDSTDDNFTSYTDTSPELGDTVEYSITAFDAYGESATASDEGYTTILAPVSFNASDSYEDRIELTWLDQSGKEQGFRVYREGELLATLGEDITSYTDRWEPALVGSYDTPGLASGVFIAGSYAYVADYTSGLQVIDVSTPGSPTLAGSYDTPGSAFDVFVAGSYAYLADVTSGLQVIDVSTPGNPTLAGSYDTPGSAFDVFVAGSYAYVADGTSGLQVIDVSTPGSPTLAGSYDTPGSAVGVSVAGSYAYVADYTLGLQVIDVSTPGNPTLAGSYDTPGSAFDVFVAGSYAYVADGTSGLQVIDVSTPGNPTLAGSYDTPGSARSVSIVGSCAYVADYTSGLQVIDVSAPGNPTLAGSYDTWVAANGVAAASNLVCIGDGGSGLQVVRPLDLDPYEYYVQAYGGTLTADSGADAGSIYISNPPAFEETALDQKLPASDAAQGDKFGVSVAIDGDRAIVGAYYNDVGSNEQQGAAYVFERGGGGLWIEKKELLEGDAYDLFGISVGISEDWAIVGAPGVSTNGYGSGWAYIFVRSGGSWTKNADLQAETPAANESFGRSVAISGDRAIIGAYEADLARGSAYVFERDADGAWTAPQKIVTPEGGSISVAISGDRAIVGAPLANSGRGVAYVFERNVGGTWDQAEVLSASDGSDDDKFGWSVAISGDRAIIGAHGDDSYRGSAYVFERDAGGAWTALQKLVAPDGEGSDFFGISVAISGDCAIIGAIGDDSLQGAAYVFERDAGGMWTPTQKLVAADGEGGGVLGDYFGQSVAVSGGTAMVGAYNDDVGASNQQGSVYVVELAGMAQDVSATDGSLKSRVRVTWKDRSPNEQGFRVYRDGEPLGSQIAPNVEVYEDFDAEPGRTYQYGVATIKNDLSEELPEVLDYGWRPANGNITGRISTRGGAAAEGIAVKIDPVPTKALLFDGAGGHVIVSNEDSTFGFTSNRSYTIETWVKYASNGGSGDADGTMIAKVLPEGGTDRYPFSIGNMRGASEPGRIYFRMSDGTVIVSVNSTGTEFNDNTWHHIACVHNADERMLLLYVDGELQGQTTYAALDNIANTEPLTLGAGADNASWFGGQLDEVRIWSGARSPDDIHDYKDKQLVGDEAGLLAYWPLDEGSVGESSSEGGKAAITDLASGAHYGVFVGGVYWSETATPLNVDPVTDAEGNYVLRGIRYGNLGEFKVRPYDGERQFEPAYRMVTLSTEDPVENQVDFTDISSFTVSGVVRYGGTNCPAPDIQILVDDQPSAVTDKNGKFAVSVDYVGEDTPYTIAASLEGHEFDPESYTIVVDHDTLLVDSNGVTFADTTQRTLSGLVGGGCGRSVGDVIITVRSENNCLLASDTTDTAYSFSLPPQAYRVTATVVEASIPAGLNKPDVVKFFQNLGERRVDLASEDAALDFVYHAPLVVTITGMESFVTCDQLTFDGRTLPEDLPVIPQETLFELTITVNEDYGAGGTCPLDGGTVTIYDEIADRADKPFVLQVRNGTAGLVDAQGEFIPNYRTAAISPSLIVGRTDEQGNDRTYQKYVRAVATVEGRSPVTATQWALVTGHIAPEGADFVTMTTAPMPFYVLRDPPGDKSYAYLDKGYTSRSTIDFDIGSFTTNEDGEIRNLRSGISIQFTNDKIGILSWTFGVPWANEMGLMFEIQYDSQYRYTQHETIDKNGATVVTTSIDETFATSPNDLFTGGKGDVFVGAGLNYLFAEVGVLEVNEACQVIRSQSVGFEPKGFETTFAYSEQYISDVLIPEIESKVEYYQELSHSPTDTYADSAGTFETMAQSWRDMLAENENRKRNAYVKENRSFSAGADYAYSFTSDTTETYRKSTSLFKDEESGKGGYTNLFGAFDFEWLDVDFSHTSEVQELMDTTGTRSTTVGYVLSDDDLGDHFTVDIKQDSFYPSPVFEVRGGASSCPYEPWADPAGKARMVPRDKPVLSVTPDPTQVNGVIPAGEPAIFTLNLSNLSPTDEGRLYVLRLLTASNPDGAIVKVGGETIMNGLQQYFIDPGQTQHAMLTVERGPTEHVYENLAVMLYPPCEYALWEQGAPLQRADTVYFSVTFEDDGPLAFESREPSDGELSFGEDISITFVEAINCQSVDATTVALTYVDGPDAGEAIDITTFCNDRTIIVTPTVSEDLLEGRTLEARVVGIRDRSGNVLSRPITWEFEYRKSQFAWSGRQLNGNLTYLSPGALTATLANGTDQAVGYTIAKPTVDWFTVSPMSGSLEPSTTQAITLDIRDDLELGVYETQVTAEFEGGVAVLDVYLTVTCNEPSWAVNPSSFEHSMTMVAELDMGGALSTDGNDKVAAFVGSQLRGVAQVDTVLGLAQPYVAFLTIYGNRASGETVRFQLWDDSACKLYNATDKTYAFVSNGVIGSPNAPVTLTGATVLGDSVLTIAANEGWTWISTNVTSADMSVNAFLSDVTPTSGDLFKSKAGPYSQFDEVTGWAGTLVNLDNVSGYMLRLTDPGTILHTGQPMEAPFTIPVVENWNWIGYLPDEAYPVAYALDDLSSLAVTGDVIKSQDAFAEYVSPNWYGSLDVLEPGKGYKLYLSGASPDPGDSFDYPDTPPTGFVAVAERADDDDAKKASPAEGTPYWSVNPHAYQNNMTVTGVLRVGGVESIDERDLVGAFVGDECRGVAQPVYLEGLRRYEVFLMVHSNEASGERVSLRAFDADGGVVYDVTETLTFEADKVHGTVQSPVALTTGGVHEEGGAAVPSVFAMGQNHPNPFNPTTTIDYDVPSGGGKVTIRIYDVGGRLVRTLLDRTETPGRKTITWDGMSNSGQTVATGVYFYRMTAPGFEKTLKMIMMK